jgi:hypothetical protein
MRKPALTAAVALAALGGIAAAQATPREERAREASMKAVDAIFDPSWILPRTRTDPDARRDQQPHDLAKEFRLLAKRRFDTPAGDAPDARLRSFADLVEGLAAFGDDRAGRDAFLDWIASYRRDIFGACGNALRQLGRDEFLRSAKWDAKSDDERDGMFTGRPFRADCEGTRPWTEIDGDPMVQQGVVVFRADLDAIKDAENDYTVYPANAGAEYEFIHGVAGSYVKAKDAKGRPVSALRMAFRQPLPFPYSHYDCDLHVLNRLGEDGNLITDIWSPSKDFDWMAGEDEFIPLETADGAFAGTLCVRVFGFDLDGVPDGEDDVRQALRSSLGNLKRRADARFAEHVARGGKPRVTKGAIPDFVMRGVQ